MPELYPVYHDAPNVRFFTMEDYLVLYKVNKQEAIIEIHPLVNSRADILGQHIVTELETLQQKR